MSLLKPHVAAMKRGFYPSLAALSHALVNPAGIKSPRHLASVEQGLSAWIDALERFAESVEKLSGTVFNVDICDEISRAATTGEFEQALGDLLQTHAGLRQVMHLVPGPLSRALENLARNQLESIAMWLAEMVLTLDEPERLLVNPDGSESFNLNLSYPDEASELERWIIKPSGYDSGHIRAALKAVLRAPAIPEEQDEYDLHFQATQAPSRPPRGFGFSNLFWGAVLGFALFDIFDDDCNGD